MSQSESHKKNRGPSGCTVSPDEIKSSVRERYAQIIASDSKTSCSCQPVASFEQAVKGKLTRMIGYSDDELESIPEDASQNSLGCGNPLVLAGVKEGEVVLDIGSGAGIDVLLASQKVGKTGKVIGLDMTPEMLERGKENAKKAGVDNVEFRLGEAESMPIEDGTVDLIISNCVINLSPDKKKVFQEAYRVLKPDGRILISDIVNHNLPQMIKDDMEAWAECVGGSLEEEEYLKTIREAGFERVEIAGRIAITEKMAEGLISSGTHPEEALSRFRKWQKEGFRNGMISSIKVRAVKHEVDERRKE
jgi:SAM-dependent methyltransferase